MKLVVLAKGRKRPIGYVTAGGYKKTKDGWRKVSMERKTAAAVEKKGGGSRQESLEGENIVYHHTGIADALDILKLNKLKAGYLNEYKWISFTSQLDYPKKRLPASPEVSLQFDKKALAESHDLVEKKREVEKGETTIQKRTLPIKGFLKKVVIREDLSQSEYKDWRDEYNEFIDLLKKKNIEYTFMEYKG